MLNFLEDHIDFSNFPEDHPRFSNDRKAMFGFVKVDTANDVIHAFLGEKKKSYQLFTSQSTSNININNLARKTVKKGCPNKTASKIQTKDILRLYKKDEILKMYFRKLQSKKHIISMIQQEKTVSSSFDNSAFYKTCGLCNVPFYCSLKDIQRCDSIECFRNKLLINIWYRIVNNI